MCRPETYRIKATIDLTLRGLTQDLQQAADSEQLPDDQSVNDMRYILPLYEYLLRTEDPGPTSLRTLSTEPSYPYAREVAVSGIICDFCGADIYNGFLECKQQCLSEPIQTNSANKFAVCPGCYSEGRSCQCCQMKAVQLRPFQLLQDALESAKAALARVSSAQESLATMSE